jgi:hypothetical protein
MSADERKVRKLQRRHIEEDQLTRDNGLKHLLSTYEGRRLYWLILEDCGVFRNPFTGNALSTAFNAGEQNVGQKLLAHLMNTSPQVFPVMQKESADVHRNRTADAAKLGSEYDTYGADDPDDV